MFGGTIAKRSECILFDALSNWVLKSHLEESLRGVGLLWSEKNTKTICTILIPSIPRHPGPPGEDRYEWTRKNLLFEGLKKGFLSLTPILTRYDWRILDVIRECAGWMFGRMKKLGVGTVALVPGPVVVPCIIHSETKRILGKTDSSPAKVRALLTSCMFFFSIPHLMRLFGYNRHPKSTKYLVNRCLKGTPKKSKNLQKGDVWRFKYGSSPCVWMSIGTCHVSTKKTSWLMISLPQNSENLNWLWARRLFLQYFATAVHFETAKIALRNIGTWWAYATEQIRLYTISKPHQVETDVQMKRNACFGYIPFKLTFPSLLGVIVHNQCIYFIFQYFFHGFGGF